MPNLLREGRPNGVHLPGILAPTLLDKKWEKKKVYVIMGMKETGYDEDLCIYSWQHGSLFFFLFFLLALKIFIKSFCQTFERNFTF